MGEVYVLCDRKRALSLLNDRSMMENGNKRHEKLYP